MVQFQIGVRQTLSVLVVAFALLVVTHIVMANKDRAIALAPQYQQSLLAAIQRVAVFLRIETEPTWATLRQDILAQITIPKLSGSLAALASSMIVGVIVVFLYAVFLCIIPKPIAAIKHL